VLLMGGAFLLLLAIVPGLPALPFACLALLLGGGGLWLHRSRGERPARADDAAAPSVPAIAPLAVELGAELSGLARGALAAAIDRVRARLLDELGLPLPAVDVRIRADAATRGYRLQLWQVPIAHGELAPELTPEAGAERVAGAIDALARRHAAELLGVQETQQLLDGLERSAPALVHSAVPKPISLRVLCDVLRCLLDERIAIRALGPILEALSTEAPGTAVPDPAQLAERVRARLSRQISAAHAHDGVLAAHALDPLIEDALRDALPSRGAGQVAIPALPPDQARDIVEAVRRTLTEGRTRAVLLTQADVRRHLRALLRSELPEVTVLSYAELVPELRVERRPAIRIGGDKRAHAQAD
jgi:type III secretion protein V